MVNKKNLLILGLACFVLVSVLAWIGFWQKTPSKSPSPVNSKEPKIQLTLNTVYKKCHHIETQKKTIQAFRWEEFEGWRLERQHGSIILLQREEEDLCPICLMEEFMGTHQGKVVIYHGRPDRMGPVKETLPINIHDLPAPETRDLERGIVIHDAKEKLLLLEGLSSLSDG